MEARFVKTLERHNIDYIRRLMVKVEQQGNSPEGLRYVEFAQEARQAIRNYKDIPRCERYIQAKLLLIVSPETLKEQTLLMGNITNPKLRVLSWEKYFLEKISGGEVSASNPCFWDVPIFTPRLTQHLIEGEYFEAKLLYDAPRHRIEHWLDSVWVNGTFKKEKPFELSLPALRAGKHTIDFKIKHLHKKTPEKDITIFYTHTFHVLPRKK